MLGWDFLFKLLIWLSIIAVIGIAIYFIYKIYSEYNRLVSSNKRERRKINSLQKKLNSINKDIKSLDNKFSKQKNEINKLNTELKSVRNKLSSKEGDFKSERNIDNVKNVNKKQALFFTVPNSDGEFDNKMSSSNPEGRNYYKITSEKDSKEGKIEFRSGELDASALDHRDSILRPVCEIKNSTASNPSRIENIALGKVKRVGDKWVIEERVKIKLQ